MDLSSNRCLKWGLIGSLVVALALCLALFLLATRAGGETTDTAPPVPGDNQPIMTTPPAEETYRQLTPEEENVILRQGTERPFTGEYTDHFAAGLYTCKRCGAMLYHWQDKFPSHYGWPSFDHSIPGAVKRTPDADGIRTEITCAHCGGHLGHVFEGEGLTDKDTRYCVNSISMLFLPEEQVKYGQAYFAAGCFWGIQHLLDQQPGVLQTTVGYTGGHTETPTYQQVCSHTTGHAEAVAVLYDPVRVSFETLAKLFFEIHDPTQLNRQGPDRGDQYRSAIFYTTDEQQQVAEKLIAELKGRGMNVVTEVTPAGPFWPGEDYHQEYYQKQGGQPYCHARKQLW